MNKEQLIERSGELEDLKINFANDVKTFVQDRTVPLDERWDVFKLAECGNRKEAIIHDLDNVLSEYFDHDFSWFDDLYVERYQTTELVEVVERMYFDAKWEHDQNKNENLYKEKLQKIDDIKEKILECFIWSFVYDW